MQEIEMPARIAALPRDDKGRPVPFFVLWKDGVPDFRVTDPRKIAACTVDRLCWICGEKLGRFLAFVIGPMSSVYRLSAEPPSHFDCATYAVQVCPFLTHPNLQRRSSDIHTADEVVALPGNFLAPNPGVTLVWVTRDYQVHQGALPFKLGEPVKGIWYTEGRLATRSEVEASFNRSLSELAGTGVKLKQLEHSIKKAKEIWPTV
jgi:hypothetical protein